MARHERQPFDAKGEYVAKRNFKTSGNKTFQRGDDFPWKRLSIDVRTLHRLWMTNFIEIKGSEPSLDKEPVEEVEETSEEVVEEISEESVDSDEGAEFLYDPEVHHLLHLGANEWWIMRGEDKVFHVNRKEWKRLEKKTKPVKVNLDRVVSGD